MSGTCATRNAATSVRTMGVPHSVSGLSYEDTQGGHLVVPHEFRLTAGQYPDPSSPDTPDVSRRRGGRRDGTSRIAAASISHAQMKAGAGGRVRSGIRS